MSRRSVKADDPNVFPCVVLIDTREQRPFLFNPEQLGGTAVAVEFVTLASGDYSLNGYERSVAIERKSAADLFGTVTQGRDRFVRELARLADFRYAAVVVEAEWSEVCFGERKYTETTPKTVYRSVLAWQQRYPRVHWWFCPGREFAEYTTFRILERFWRERQAKAAAANRSACEAGQSGGSAG